MNAHALSAYVVVYRIGSGLKYSQPFTHYDDALTFVEDFNEAEKAVIVMVHSMCNHSFQISVEDHT
jgi:hypothetical protein